MTEKSTSATTPDDQNIDDTYSLTNIPVEIFLHICSFLDPVSLKNLDLVCKYIHTILADQSVWRTRLKKRWCVDEKEFPPIPPDLEDEDFNWKEACFEIENTFNLFQEPESNWKHNKYGDVHYGEVDTVVLFEKGTRCVSASRDHTMVLWDLSADEINWTRYNDVHKGWIWNLAYDEQTKQLNSCSFDRTVKSWDFEYLLNPTYAFQCSLPCLSVTCNSGEIFTGLLNGFVFHLDPRQKRMVDMYPNHRRATLSLAIAQPDHLVSVGEDESYCILDLRKTDKSLIRNSLYHDKLRRQGKTPLCISYNNDILYIGDSGGKLHLIDAKNGLYKHIGMYDIGHKDKLTSIHHNRGRLITCSADCSVRVYAPTNEPTHLLTLNSCNKLNKLYYQNRTLALAGCESSVEFYRHKSLDTITI